MDNPILIVSVCMGKSISLTLKGQIMTAATTNFAAPFPIFDKNKVWHYMKIVCHALFVIFEKKKQKNLQLSSAANYRWLFKG